MTVSLLSNSSDDITYSDFHRWSVTDRDAFWSEQARLIEWQREPPAKVCDNTHPPFARWFAGGTTNLCHNAVDRHVVTQPDQPALIAVSAERGTEQVYSFASLLAEVQIMAAALQSLGIVAGDRVLIYMPMVAEAVIAMLACARIGAVHSVVFGGFASAALAKRIDDAKPKLVVSADAGLRNKRVIPYKPLLDEALQLANYPPLNVLLVDRGLAPIDMVVGRDQLWSTLRQQHLGSEVPCVWVDATHPSYILYTSGTTGNPKGVQRDTGGYAVALAASMRHIFDARAGQTFLCTSDIGWVVGHSYIVYGPLIAGMATIVYEGTPLTPDPGVWWRLVERHRVSHMFSAPTAVRVLKKEDISWITRSDLSSLQGLWLAGEPLDEPTARWISDVLNVPVIDNYWQTESGWPILSVARGVGNDSGRVGSPGLPMYGFDVRLVDEHTGQDLPGIDSKGVVAIAGPLPPGCLQTLWRDDQRFVDTYWRKVADEWLYSTFDWGQRDADGYWFILGRTDDVINVAGHRLGTREIEEVIASHADVVEVAVVGVADGLRGQAVIALVVPRDSDICETPALDQALRKGVEQHVAERLGALARPQRVLLVPVLPKTRSGKLLRRAIQAVCEGRDAGDLTTLEDAAALQQLQVRLAAD